MYRDFLPFVILERAMLNISVDQTESPTSFILTAVLLEIFLPDKYIPRGLRSGSCDPNKIHRFIGQSPAQIFR